MDRIEVEYRHSEDRVNVQMTMDTDLHVSESLTGEEAEYLRDALDAELEKREELYVEAGDG